MTNQPSIPACLWDDAIRQQPAQRVTRKMRQDGNKEGILVYGFKFSQRISSVR